jgi:hypothetical protein
MSPLTMWLNSWAMTPWSCSRSSRRSAPSVTAMAASLGVLPAAKALIPSWPASTKTAGTGTPEAMAISSTTLSRRRSPATGVSGGTQRPPRLEATEIPPARSAHTFHAAAPPTRAAVPSATWANSPGRHQLADQSARAAPEKRSGSRRIAIDPVKLVAAATTR